MNKDLFLQYIENSRDCEQDLLEKAVNRGLYRARNDRFDTRKLFMLAAACVITFVMCITVNLNPFRMAVDKYYVNWNKTMPAASEVLVGYYYNIANNIIKHLGGE